MKKYTILLFLLFVTIHLCYSQIKKLGKLDKNGVFTFSSISSFNEYCLYFISKNINGVFFISKNVINSKKQIVGAIILSNKDLLHNFSNMQTNNNAEQLNYSKILTEAIFLNKLDSNLKSKFVSNIDINKINIKTIFNSSVIKDLKQNGKANIGNLTNKYHEKKK
jgi:hypothetical protein